MVYIFCFCLALILLLFVVHYGKSVNINIVLLIMAVAIGNGGYVALSQAVNLSEAILANNMIYVMGIFTPIIIFLIISDICRIYIPNWARTIMYAIQMMVYLSVLTVGHFDIFYREVEFHMIESGGYLTKTYGPMHTVYLLLMITYTLGGIGVGVYSINRKNVVSRINVDTVIFVDALTIGVYLVERLIHLNMELVPVFSVFTVIIMLFPLMKISFFSVHNNANLFDDELNNKGYILFDKNLKYMGSNEYASMLFPELQEWEMERKIPGNGGRFNTFLRQPLLRYVESGDLVRSAGKTYEYKGEIYHFEIGPLLQKGKKLRGYFIVVSNVTEVLNSSVNEMRGTIA